MTEFGFANEDKALVVFSGGQDSTTALMYALSKYEMVHVVTFMYGQRHSAEEVNAAREISRFILSLPTYSHDFIQLSSIDRFVSSALIDTQSDINTKSERNSKLPASFVPGRNILFATYAAMRAYELQIKTIIMGVNAVDYSGYPDCRGEFFSNMVTALRSGMDYPICFDLPLLNMSKADIVKLSYDYAQRDHRMYDMIKRSHTCYEGVRPGCGECNACKIRAKGFEDAGHKDPLFGGTW